MLRCLIEVNPGFRRRRCALAAPEGARKNAADQSAAFSRVTSARDVGSMAQGTSPRNALLIATPHAAPESAIKYWKWRLRPERPPGHDAHGR